jgi:hypothetical protein
LTRARINRTAPACLRGCPVNYEAYALHEVTG